MTISIQTLSDGGARITAPFNDEWRIAARNMDGRWDSAYRAWDIPAEALDSAKEKLNKIFGWTDAPTHHVKIRIIEDVNAEQCAVNICGKQLARARGRDSGARTGEGVILHSGRIKSGGSAKYWLSIVEKDSVFSLDLPVDAVLPEWAEYVEEEVCDPAKQALRDEREQLIARLAEIDAELKS